MLKMDVPQTGETVNVRVPVRVGQLKGSVVDMKLKWAPFLPWGQSAIKQKGTVKGVVIVSVKQVSLRVSRIPCHFAQIRSYRTSVK